MMDIILGVKRRDHRCKYGLVLLLATYRTLCKNLGIIICAWNVKNTVAAAKMRNLHLSKATFHTLVVFPLLIIMIDFLGFSVLYWGHFLPVSVKRQKQRSYEFPLKMTPGQISCKMALWYTRKMWQIIPHPLYYYSRVLVVEEKKTVLSYIKWWSLMNKGHHATKPQFYTRP